MMVSTHDGESGHAFENRALALARAIHDPSYSQGPVIVNGLERDGVFIDARTIVAFEFTISRTKDKASKDGIKLRDLLRDLSKLSEHRNKILQGYFVTLDEPTGDQRNVIQELAVKSGLSISAMSYLTLRRQLIDTESYLALRRSAPFGSVGSDLMVSNGSTRDATRPVKRKYVSPRFTPDAAAEAVDIDGLSSLVTSGFRVVVSGDYGAGKSAALAELFELARSAYFRQPDERRFPIHINLRDCYGLRSPAEILRRHAEDIGFADDRSLIAAWRAGDADLLLDGFDELVPSRWVGGARDLQQVRWNALEPVRRLIQETPQECGVVVSGRPQYFADAEELLRSVGLTNGVAFVIDDFDRLQVQEFLGSELSLPSWVPVRPLLLKFLFANGLTELSDGEDPAHAWLQILTLVASREAERVASVTPETTLSLISRIATMARQDSADDGISVEEMRNVFREVCGYEADEEGLQLLLRLPGLATNDSSGATTRSERRRFVDQVLADSAYGLDLALYISAPYVAHPLKSGATWSQAASSLSWSVAALKLFNDHYDPGVVLGSVQDRMSRHLFDAILFDCVEVGLTAGARANASIAPFFNEVLIPDLQLRGSDDPLEASATFKDCVFDRLDVTEVEDGDRLPAFQDCLIGRVDGWSSVPPAYSGNFATSKVEHFSAISATTSGLSALAIEPIDRVALVILKKVYAQAGSGRKESSLSRGLPLQDRGLVSDALSSLSTVGLVSLASGKGNTLVLPVRDKRPQVHEILGSPSLFRLGSL